MATECKKPADLVDRAVRVARFYGFIPTAEAPVAEQAVVSGRTNKINMKDLRFVRREERSLVRTVKLCAAKGLGDQREPALLFDVSSGDRGNGTVLELHAIGIPSAVAEGLLIAVADAIASDVGIEKRVVHINSLGAQESSARYVRDLASFLRKYIDDIPQGMRGSLLDDPISIALHLAEKQHPMLHRAPVAMDYLNEEERKHFWDVLEYLELSSTYYELNPLVLGSPDCWSQTLFDIAYVDQEGRYVPFARGGRYDVLASRCAGPAARAVSVSIALDVKTPLSFSAQPVPSVYFAHLGREAKRRAIPTLELLRRANIPVYQSLPYERLAPQMDLVKKLQVPWLLIMGHKEAVDGTMLVRDLRTNAQEEVLLPELPGYLRRRHIGAA